MELQILDNTAEKYSSLHDGQYHGSVYGIVAAKRGYLNPVGTWNYEEVIADGSHITVNLNGTTIVDTDIDASFEGRNVGWQRASRLVEAIRPYRFLRAWRLCGISQYPHKRTMSFKGYIAEYLQ